MEILIKLNAQDLAEALKKAGMSVADATATPKLAAVAAIPESAPKKRGRPPKAKVEEVEDETDEIEADEEPAPKKRGRPAKAASTKKAAVEEEDEETEADEAEDDEEDVEEEAEDEEDVEEPEYVTGGDLTKLKKALQAFAKAKGTKDAAVKVLRKFAPSSEKVKVGDLAKLMKALKV